MKYNALFIGLTTIDIQYFVDDFPVTNVKVKTQAPEILVGGPATNAAVAFSYLNNNAFLATFCGDNSFSNFMEDDFKSTGITHFDLARNSKVNPVIASVITSKNGNRNIFTHNPSISKDVEITPEEIFMITKPQIVLLDGFYPEFSLRCAKLAKSKGIPVVIDCGSWKPQYDDLLEFVDFAICSEDFYPPDCENSQDVFKYLQTLGIKYSAISRGENSLLYIEHNKSGGILPKTIDVIDTLGAGDFLHGAFCYYFLANKNFESALKSAIDLASFTCTFKGTRSWLNFKKKMSF